jgi:hypothetical protein
MPTADEQLDKARQMLRPILDLGAVILSSTASRAMYTSRALAADRSLVILPSVRVELGGDAASGISNLDDFIDKALAEAHAEVPDDTPLIVVTHSPLIEIASGRQPGYGEVVEYRRGTWQNRGFDPGWEDWVEQQVAAAIGT